MDDPQDISVRSAPQDADRDQRLFRNVTHLAPPSDPTLAGTIAKRPAVHRLLLAGHIDRQFPLIRFA